MSTIKYGSNSGGGAGQTAQTTSGSVQIQGQWVQPQQQQQQQQVMSQQQMMAHQQAMQQMAAQQAMQQQIAMQQHQQQMMMQQQQPVVGGHYIQPAYQMPHPPVQQYFAPQPNQAMIQAPPSMSMQQPPMHVGGSGSMTGHPAMQGQPQYSQPIPQPQVPLSGPPANVHTMRNAQTSGPTTPGTVQGSQNSNQVIKLPRKNRPNAAPQQVGQTGSHSAQQEAPSVPFFDASSVSGASEPEAYVTPTVGGEGNAPENVGGQDEGSSQYPVFHPGEVMGDRINYFMPKPVGGHGALVEHARAVFGPSEARVVVDKQSKRALTDPYSARAVSVGTHMDVSKQPKYGKPGTLSQRESRSASGALPFGLHYEDPRMVPSKSNSRGYIAQ